MEHSIILCSFGFAIKNKSKIILVLCVDCALQTNDVMSRFSPTYLNHSRIIRMQERSI